MRDARPIPELRDAEAGVVRGDNSKAGQGEREWDDEVVLQGLVVGGRTEGARAGGAMCPADGRDADVCGGVFGLLGDVGCVWPENVCRCGYGGAVKVCGCIYEAGHGKA